MVDMVQEGGEEFDVGIPAIFIYGRDGAYLVNYNPYISSPPFPRVSNKG